MVKNNYIIVVVALIFGVIAWVAEASIDFFFVPAKPFLDQLFFDLPPHEIYERLILLTFVTAAVIIALKSVSYHRKSQGSPVGGRAPVGEHLCQHPGRLDHQRP